MSRFEDVMAAVEAVEKPEWVDRIVVKDSLDHDNEEIYDIIAVVVDARQHLAYDNEARGDFVHALSEAVRAVDNQRGIYLHWKLVSDIGAA